MDFVTPRQILNEISTQDAYNRFYKGVIPEKMFMELMNGQSKLTPFHKICLTYMANEDEESEFPHMLALEVGKDWAELTPEKRQVLVDMAKGGEIEPEYPSIVKAMKEVKWQKYQNASQIEKDGFVEIYEDKGIKLTCTLTYAASCHHFGHTRWCTASDVFGDVNGWDMFRDYTCEYSSDENDDIEANACLLQLFVKKTGQLYQFTMNEEGSCGTICDQEDNMITPQKLVEIWNENAVINWSEFFEYGNLIDISDLIYRTEECLKNETKYMSKVIKKKKDELANLVNERMSSFVGFDEYLTKSIELSKTAPGESINGGGLTFTSYYFKNARMQAIPKYGCACTVIGLDDPRYGNFFFHSGKKPTIYTFIEHDTSKILFSKRVSDVVDGDIMGVFGVLYRGTAFVDTAINLNTGEQLQTDEYTRYFYSGGYIAFGQVSWVIYNMYTGKVVVERAFHISNCCDDNTNFRDTMSYTKTMDRNGERVVLPFVSKYEAESAERMKEINEIIN